MLQRHGVPARLICLRDLRAHRIVLQDLPAEYRWHYTLATISVTKRSICVFSSALLLPR